VTIPLTEEQYARLRDLGASEDWLSLKYASNKERDQAYRSEERRLVTLAREKLRQIFASGGRPKVETLAEDISKVLSAQHFVQVSTPIIMSRSRLVKMGLEGDPLLAEQVFWLDPKHCLRPMLAPHLYEYMLDLSKLRNEPFGVFEVGPCFRKESQGSRHASEFTMLNLVEVGLPISCRNDRLAQLASLVLDAAGLKNWRLETVESTVYGETVDVVDQNGLEIASCSMGPHPLDQAWGFSGTWVGLGLGLERLAMALGGLDRLSLVGRCFGRLMGVPLRL
jgi:phenylalanyl-tRNA synthetase alpha chain